MYSVYRSNSPESSSHGGSASRVGVRQSQQRYSTTELYKPQTSRRRSPSANALYDSHEWYDWCALFVLLRCVISLSVNAVVFCTGDLY